MTAPIIQFPQGESLDAAAERLGRWREAHARKPDCQQTYVRYLETSMAFNGAWIAALAQQLKELKAENTALKRELTRRAG